MITWTIINNIKGNNTIPTATAVNSKTEQLLILFR